MKPEKAPLCRRLWLCSRLLHVLTNSFICFDSHKLLTVFLQLVKVVDVYCRKLGRHTRGWRRSKNHQVSETQRNITTVLEFRGGLQTQDPRLFSFCSCLFEQWVTCLQVECVWLTASILALVRYFSCPPHLSPEDIWIYNLGLAYLEILFLKTKLGIGYIQFSVLLSFPKHFYVSIISCHWLFFKNMIMILL